MPRGLSCSCTIFCRSTANSGVEVGLWGQPVAARIATISQGETLLISTNITHQPCKLVVTISWCPSAASWLISPAFHERRPQNARTTGTDDGHRPAPAFRVPRPGHGDFENLAGGAVRRRASGRERFLLRCRSSAPDFAGRFREDRGRDEEGDQSEPSVRKNGSFARRSTRPRKERAPGRAGRSRSTEQIQDRHHRKHSARRENLALSQRRFHRSLRRAACDADGKCRRVQAHHRGECVLQRRRKESAAPTYLRNSI